jgi:hypothetical protein
MQKKQTSIEWYKSLDVNMRINVKDVFILLTGIDFSRLNFLFSYREKIEIMHQKLIREAII